ncbi:unnamed protein product [Vicia faba]|uniref:GAG-pre-integrase domain-containing protein n=1 Tax=Vicia faba TaxID=3906 RepID=A0AAV0Z614_VICFA|nr:unnamed protein product [Vicia faba]
MHFQCNKSPSLYQSWHCRLEHPHHETLKNVLNVYNIPLPNKNMFDFCNACYLGKAHRLPSYASNTNYIKPFELVFCDLWGPAPVASSCGYTYFLTCVDAFSLYTWIYPLKLKSHC